MEINYHKKHFTIRDEYIELVNDNPLSVCKHLIKKIGDTSYYSGKIYLSGKIFPVEKYKDIQYKLINVKLPIHYLNKNWWGKGKIIFLRDALYENPIKEKIKLSSKYLSLERDGKLQIHRRKSKGKIYTSFKLPISNTYLGKKLYLFSYKPQILLEFYELREGLLLEDRQKKVNAGRVYLLYERDTKEAIKIGMSIIKDGVKTRRAEVIYLLKKGKKPLDIANQLQISENAVWRNVANSYKKGDIKTWQLINIVKDYSSKFIIDIIFIKLEGERRRVNKYVSKYLEDDNLNEYEKKRYLKTALKEDITPEKLKEWYKKETGRILNHNHTECIILLYRELTKFDYPHIKKGRVYQYSND